MHERDCLIALSVAGLHYSKPLSILKEYFGSFEDVFYAPGDLLEKVIGPGPYRNKVIQGAVEDKAALQHRVDEIKERHSIITLLDDQYPENLKEIYDPPWVLYIKGKPLKSNPMIGMVGARKASTYGKWAADYFARELTKFGVGVVSGLAYGIDAAGHQGCLNAGGYSVGVLGCGIDKTYPSYNQSLYRELEENGTIISEYGPGVEPQKHFFPARNRIISGLSAGIFVIEAREKSGSLITAEFAMEQGREVFALPGNINSQLSAGTNKLLRDGARCVLEINDIIEPIASMLPMEHYNDTMKEVSIPLSEQEKRVLILIAQEPTPIEVLLHKAEFTISELNGILTILELKGLVQQLPGKRFTACR